MRAYKSKLRNQGRRILVGVAVLAAGLIGLSGLQRWWLGSARLVSIEEMPDTGDACYRPVSAQSGLSAASENLFSAFEETSVYAQDAKNVDITRQPVRDILDTAPIYSSVGLDLEHNEVMLQDANTWSLKFFSRLDNSKPGDPS